MRLYSHHLRFYMYKFQVFWCSDTIAGFSSECIPTQVDPSDYSEIFASVYANGTDTVNNSVFYPEGIVMPSDGELLFGFVDGSQRLTNLSFDVSPNVDSASFDFLFGDVSIHFSQAHEGKPTIWVSD